MSQAADGFGLQVSLLDGEDLYRLLDPIVLNYRSSVRSANAPRSAVASRNVGWGASGRIGP